MKYRFITIMHNMKLDAEKKRGFRLFPGARISNGVGIINETMKTKLLMYTAGIHSVREFNNTVYFYVDGEFKEIDTKEKMDEVGTNYTFYFLRVIQSFLNQLWEVKDNNVYVRDGFLVVYNKVFEDGFTYKASLSAIFTCSTLEEKETIFSDEELSIAKSRYEMPNVEESQIYKIDYKCVCGDIYFKYSKSERIDRALSFIINARGISILPLKILSYCTAFECLFTNTQSEISHRIAERVALYAGGTTDEKKDVYKLIKKAYEVRSIIIHGSYLKGSSDDLVDISKGLDSILRSILTKDTSIFSKGDKEIEEFFMDLLFM